MEKVTEFCKMKQKDSLSQTEFLQIAIIPCLVIKWRILELKGINIKFITVLRSFIKTLQCVLWMIPPISPWGSLALLSVFQRRANEGWEYLKCHKAKLVLSLMRGVLCFLNGLIPNQEETCTSHSWRESTIRGRFPEMYTHHHFKRTVTEFLWNFLSVTWAKCSILKPHSPAGSLRISQGQRLPIPK